LRKAEALPAAKKGQLLELVDCMDMMPKLGMQYREQFVVFRKGEASHNARIVTYMDIKK
jgi:hypothetical protein